MLKKLARKLQDDYIPGGKIISSEEFKNTKFRRTRENEVYQCGAITGYDPQSTHIFCGRVAEWIHISHDGAIALCDRAGHAPPPSQREEVKPPVTVQLPQGPTIILPE